MADRMKPSRDNINPFDPPAQRTADLKPGEDDVIARENPRRGETPRRYDGEVEKDDVMPSNDSTIRTRI